MSDISVALIKKSTDVPITNILANEIPIPITDIEKSYYVF